MSLVGYFIVGSTAVGKSSVAHRIAENLGCDILSADSMLVYDGMDIGTAKPSRAERARVAYHGIDLVTPDRPFSVWEYHAHAMKALKTSAAAGRKCIVAGGTGLYIKSLTDGLARTPRASSRARAYWEVLRIKKGVEALQEALCERAPILYESLSDKQNPRRLIRALEMADAGIVAPRQSWKEKRGSVPLAGLMLPAEQLKLNIETRVKEMYRRGFVDEVRRLLERYEFSATASQAIGYAEAICFLRKQCSQTDAMARTAVRTRQLAKRQQTWFRRQANVRWLEIRLDMDVDEIGELVLGHWGKYGPTEIAE